MSNPVVLVAASDLHLDHKPPAARAETQKEWYAVMGRQLDELAGLCETHDCPLVVPGDVFNAGWDTHRTPPELVNFVLARLARFPRFPVGNAENRVVGEYGVLAVPGQHDLPYHRLADVQRSAYWTLVQSGTVCHLHNPEVTVLCPGTPTVVDLVGFPWGVSPAAYPAGDRWGGLRVAVVHRYVWWGSHCHPGVTADQHIDQVPRQFPGFDVVLFGDNHQGFYKTVTARTRTATAGDGTRVVNCGTFMRRTADEREHRPFATLVRADGTVEDHRYQSIKHDKWVEYDGQLKVNDALDRYTSALRAVTQVTEDFPETVRAEMRRRGIGGRLRRAILDCLEGDE